MITDYFVPVPAGTAKQQESFVRRLVEAMDQEGVRHACVSGAGPRFKEADLNAVTQAVHAHPDRLVGIGFLLLGTDGPACVDDYRNRGFRGLRTCAPPSPYDDAFMPVYERACKWSLPIQFQTGSDSRRLWDNVYWDRIGMESPAYLDRIARTFPQLGVVGTLNGSGVRHCTHWLWNELNFLVGERGYANVFFECSVCGIPPEHPWTTAFLEHVVWASGGPPESVGDKLKLIRRQMDQVRVPATHEVWKPPEMILGGNAARLLNLPEE